MSDVLLVGTRKGLFTLTKTSSGWEISQVDFVGQTVTMLLDDPRDQTVYASLTLGHFGSKLHRRTSDNPDWEEVAVPVYP
ncbi:MAG: exo-alpha-sialidase, partial [Planctomycetaceae bacterium]|nr:exo-alpha-sialidase [Planctomycetaceae bacterium]